MFQITRLENGLTVGTSEMPHMASVSLGVWVGTGGRHEPAELSGVSHFIEHMLFKGTRRRSAKQISQDVEGIGGYLNAFTTEESTCFYSKACHDRFPDLLEVLMDMFLNSRFSPDEIAKEKNVIKEELAMYLDQPHQHVQELLDETLWPDHPLGRALTGTEKTIDAMTREGLMNYQRENYLAPRTLIAAAGRIRHDQVVRAVSRYAKRLPQGTSTVHCEAPAEATRPRVRLFTKKTEQTQLALGIRTCSRHDERRFALRLLNTMLGENMSSRLFQVLREDHGLAYSIFSALGFFEDTGMLNISAGLETEHLAKSLKLLMRELKRAREAPPTRSELQRARDYAIGQIDLGLESTENQMMWLGEQWIGHRRTFSPQTIKHRLARVTRSEIQAVAREFLVPARMSLALVSPIKDTRSLEKLLRR